MIPLTIVTSSFKALAEAQLRARRLPELPLITVDHPVGGLTSQELESRVDQAAPQLARAMLSLGRPGGA